MCVDFCYYFYVWMNIWPCASSQVPFPDVFLKRLYIFFQRHCHRKTYPSFLPNVLINDNQRSVVSSPSFCSYLFFYFLGLFIYLYLPVCYEKKNWMSVWKGRDWDVHLEGFLYTGRVAKSSRKIDLVWRYGYPQTAA